MLLERIFDIQKDFLQFKRTKNKKDLLKVAT